MNVKICEKVPHLQNLSEEPFSQQTNTYYAACGVHGKMNIWEKSSPHLAKSITAVAPQGLRPPLKCGSNDTTQSTRSSGKGEANGRVVRTVCARVKKLKVHK